MDPFNDFQKDWKKINGGAAADETGHLSNFKNEKIMESLIKYEKREKRGILMGTIGATIGIITGLVCGIVLPVQYGLLEFTPLMGIGILLMFIAIGIIYFGSLPKSELIKAAEQPSDEFLKKTRSRMVERKKKLMKNGMLYVAVLMSGVSLVLFELNPYVSIFAFAIGILAVFAWNFNYEKQIEPMMKEIDELLEEYAS